METYKKHLKLYLSEKKRGEKSERDDRSHIMKLLDEANRELEKHYNGKYEFHIFPNDTGVSPDSLHLSPKKKREIKEIWLRFDSNLSRIQRDYEKYLQKSLQDDEDVV